MTLDIITPASTPDFDAVRLLCWDYRTFLLGLGPEDKKIIEFIYPPDKYERILAAIEVDHQAPRGGVKLAMLGDRPVGCGMFHRLDNGAAEVKRVYVRDEARGMGAGRAVMEALIDQCRADGYERILMDTGVALAAAKSLYLSMGFNLRGPYQDMPDFADGRLLFFEMELERGG